MKKWVYLLFITVSLFIACEKNEDPEPEMEEEEMGLDCDSFTDTYDSSIGAIITTNCAISGCHNADNTRRSSLADYSSVFAARSSVRNRVVSKTMPPSSRPALSQEDIDKINCWVTNGAPE